MKWKERGMVFMSKECVRYTRYLWKSNRRILILLMVSLFLLIPVTAGFTSDYTMGIQRPFSLECFNQLIEQSTICGFLLAFFVPIYQMRFLYKKQMNDLYFSLPIRKRQLFDLQFTTGLLGFLVPLIINFLLGYIVAYIYSPDSTLKLEYLLLFVLLVICLCVEYCIVCYFSIKCNHLLDSLFINGIYVVLPLILALILSSFFMNQSQLLLHENSYDTFVFIDVIANLWSVPLYFYNLFANCFVYIKQEIVFIIEKQYLLMLCYWIVIGVIFYGLAKASFVKRKEESSEQQTTAWMTYPFVISFATLLMILLLFNENHINKLVSFIVIFGIYCGAIFFSKRKIHLTAKNIIVFICLFAASYGLGFVFQVTNGFGLVSEVPAIQDLDYVNIRSYEYGYGLEESSDAEQVQHMDLYAYGNTKEELEKAVVFQKQMMEKSVNSYHTKAIYIQLNYRSKDGSKHQREYMLESSKETKEMIQAFMKEHLQMYVVE